MQTTRTSAQSFKQKVRNMQTKSPMLNYLSNS